MKLYEITGAMKDIQNLIDDDVPMDQLQDTITQIEGDFNDKAKSILFVIANINSDIESCKAEEQRLQKKRKAKENAVQRIRDYLLFNMQELNSGKIDNGILTASIRKGAPALSITDEYEIPEKFKKISTTISTDKKELLKALKEIEEGESIPGAELVQGKTTLTIK